MPTNRISLILLFFLLITTLSACSAPEPESAIEVNANYNVELDIAQLMSLVLEPASDMLWESGGWVLDAYGYEELYPCLLYTSPSPRDRTRSRMPSSA